MIKKLLSLFLSFFKVSIFTFGGGYAILPMLRREVLLKRGWITEEELLDYYAVCQCTPGVTAINVASMIGFKQCGLAGAVSAAIGVALPSLIIICALAVGLGAVSESGLVAHAFAGIRVAVSVLILSAVVSLWKTGIKGVAGAAIFIAAFICSAALDLSPVYIVLAAGLAGVLIKRRGERT